MRGWLRGLKWKVQTNWHLLSCGAGVITLGLGIVWVVRPWDDSRYEAIIFVLSGLVHLVGSRLVRPGPAGFEDESKHIRKLVSTRPALWEYRLTVALLRARLEGMERRTSDIERGLYYRTGRPLRGLELVYCLTSKINDLVRLVAYLKEIFIEEIPRSWGPPGQAGNAVEIRRAVDRAYDVMCGMLEWETDLAAIDSPEATKDVLATMTGWAAHCIQSLEHITNDLDELVQDPNASGQHKIVLVIESPPGVDECIAELDRLREAPWELF